MLVNHMKGGGEGVEWLRIAKAALLLAMPSTYAVRSRAPGVMLVGGYQVNEVLLVILYLCIGDIVDVGVH